MKLRRLAVCLAVVPVLSGGVRVGQAAVIIEKNEAARGVTLDPTGLATGNRPGPVQPSDKGTTGSDLGFKDGMLLDIYGNPLGGSLMPGIGGGSIIDILPQDPERRERFTIDLF